MWSKANSGPIGHHQPQNSPLPQKFTVPSISAVFLNASWKSCSVSVQHCLQFCPDHLSCVKVVAFQFYLLSGKQKSCLGPRKLNRVSGARQSHCSGIQFSGEKEVWDNALSWCSSQFFYHKFPGQNLCICSYSHHKSHSNMSNWLWPARTNSLWTVPLISKKIMCMLFTCLAIFGLSEFGLFHWEDCCFASG
jgi:hypothetical protein